MVTLPACPLCKFDAWPEGGMHAARSIHVRDHLRQHSIAYGCCVGSWEKFQRNVASSDRKIIAVSGQRDIAQAYNMILAAATECDVLILMHDDLEITDVDAEIKFISALTDPDVALAGVAGGGGSLGLAWWNVDPVGHQRTDAMNIDFGRREGDVDILEGSILVFSKWAIENLRFDVGYPGFHGYDEISALARSYGKRVVVADVDTHHHTNMGFKSSTSQRQWQAADLRYREKWL